MNFRYCDVVAFVFLSKNAFLLKYFVKMPLQASIFTYIIRLYVTFVKPLKTKNAVNGLIARYTAIFF